MFIESIAGTLQILVVTSSIFGTVVSEPMTEAKCMESANKALSAYSIIATSLYGDIDEAVKTNSITKMEGNFNIGRVKNFKVECKPYAKKSKI